MAVDPITANDPRVTPSLVEDLAPEEMEQRAAQATGGG